METVKSYLMLAILLALAGSNQITGQTIYYDNFDGLSGTDLNGTTPDITTGGATWVAGNDFDADGKVTNDGGSMGDSAYLPFVPQDHYIYELSAKIDTRVSPLRNNTNDWIALGFTQLNTDPESRFYDDNGSKNPVYWGMTRTNQTTTFDQTFTGVNTTGGQATATKSADHIRIVLDTAAVTWVVSWYYDGVLQRTVNVDEALKPNFQYVAISHARPDGFIDDFTLTQQLAVQAMRPNPANGNLVTSTSVTLQWQPGVYAAKHDVYIGTSFEDVNKAATSTPIIYKGRKDPNNYTVTNLTPGITYYWRIDEVNDLHPDKLWRGDIWSFRVIPSTAYNPSPSDGAKYMDPNVDLAWSPGAKAQSHKVYWGTTHPLPLVATQTATTYAIPTLAYDTLYYWRIDEVNGTSTWPGDEWEFRTIPFIPITNPNLMGWWKFDEGQGTVAIDWSGHARHGTLVNGPEWATGYDNGALQFDGLDDHVSLPIGSLVGSLTSSTFAIWVNFPNVGGASQHIFDFGTGTTVYMYLSPRTGGTGPLTFAITTGGSTTETQVTAPSTLATGWHHVAVTINADTSTIVLYLDGVEVARNTTAKLTPKNLGNTTNNWLGRNQAGGNTWLVGLLDDFRIYSQALGQEEIGRVMAGDPLLAWNPSPRNGSIPQSEHITPLSWSPGEKAIQHDVYLGTDLASVEAAGTGTAGIYRSRQSATTYNPPETLVWGQTYYWRIDEYNSDATVSKGNIWSFTVADYLFVEDFEDYNDFSNVIYLTWIDGYGSPTQGIPGNGSGSTVGHLDPPYAETVIFNSGKQSMPMTYDNTKLPYYSEAVRTWATGQDWTRLGVKALTLWFRGIPASVGSLNYDQATGTYTITGSGADIWGTADQFHFAFKTLTGDGTIIARIDSITNTAVWAKAGVMIRETLDSNSPSIDAVVSADNRVAMQWRTEQGIDMDSPNSSTNTVANAFTLPHWVKLTRQGYIFTVQHSADGVTWQDIVPETAGDPLSITLTMGQTVYIGLAVTAHNTSATCEAKISHVTINGSPASLTTSQDIGIASNDPAALYVTLEDDTGGKKTVNHPNDPNAVLQNTWQEWNIPLNQFTGVKIDKIKKISIGTGNKTPGGSGSLYFDDVRLYRSRCVPSMAKPAADISGDCIVNYLDLDILAGDWLLADEIIATTPPSTAGLAGYWKFDGNATDSSGNGRNGTVNGAPQWIPVGQTGGALAFDGTDDYVNFPIGPVIASMNNCTIATWVNFSNAGGAWQRIFDFGSDPNVYMFLSPRTGTAGAMRFAITTSGNTAQSQLNAPATLATGWHHVAVVIDGTSKNMQLYLDGISIVNGPTQVLPKDLGSTTQNWLGRSQYTTDAYFNGALDDFRIYSRVLSKAEIAYLGDNTPGDGQIYIPLGSDADLYSAEPAGSKKINLKDFAVLASGWLEEILWP